MATSTLIQTIASNPSIIPALISGFVAAVVALLGQYYFFMKNDERERYQKLYGPLTYHLLIMKLLTSNRKQLTAEIEQELGDSDLQTQQLQTHGRPLVLEWIEHKENIEKLFEEYPGQIKKNDLKLVNDFLDGCIKRKITEDGKNSYATKERIDKILSAIKSLQNRFLRF